MKEENQGASDNERKRQGVASVTASAAKAAARKESAKRKGEEKGRPKPERLSHSVSAGQRK